MVIPPLLEGGLPAQAFVPTELAALAECTGIQSPAAAHEKSDGDLSLASNQENTAESSEADEDEHQWQSAMV